ncbi:LysR family transcriptional regulator [Noviherbaspirillum sedimenti]|uniref:LysR family transcriptional regulator n=1 Tax=Noviherbaspirillum sedimenti TaxID=2320865 RepID=A0A3A3FWQ4_9BURK|nr:LysR family transcriptional regulator [Noviherbaspirillum sedimenti]RJG00653.1 LysR family transcriptional regulator [Noviherbaspirillum sedimenti]
MTPDLNLYRLFLMVFDERSVSAAAARLNVTQPAVSHALNRLRLTLGDRLFTRSPSGLRPTPYALDIEPRVRQAIRSLMQSSERTNFDPHTTERSFTIAAGPYLCELVAQDLLIAAITTAPRSQFLIRKHTDRLVEDLVVGNIDLTLGTFGRIPAQLAAQPLLTEDMVWVVRKGHPMAETIDVAALLALPRLNVSAANSAEDEFMGSNVDGLERRLTINPEEVLMKHMPAAYHVPPARGAVYDNRTAMQIIARSNMAAFLPRRLVQAHALELGLRIVDVPMATDAVTISMLWSRDRTDSAAHIWLRELTLRVIADRFCAMPPSGLPVTGHSENRPNDHMKSAHSDPENSSFDAYDMHP